MKKPCLIFDMDGTLWNTVDEVLVADNMFIEKKTGVKNKLTKELLSSLMGAEIEEFANVTFPQYDEKTRVQYMLECMAFEDEYLSEYGGKLYPNVKETLERLSKDYNLMVVTNAGHGYVEAMYKAHDLGKYFSDYETYGNTFKPKGENIKMIMERNGYDHAIYVGDTLKDYEACQLAGIPMIYCSYGFGKVENYWKKIDQFSDLIEVLK